MHHGKLTQAEAEGLRVLRDRIASAKIPPSKLDETLNVATWNIREFGRKKRLDASLHFIAEIIGQFDLVSVVELRDDVAQLAQVMTYLGPYWDVVFSDYITDAGGNHERIGFVFDRRAVTFTGLASNAQAPRKKDKKTGDYVSAINWWRPPYMASFRAGNFDFVLVSAHIRWAGDDEAQRLPELELLAEWVARRVKEDFITDKDIVVAGDFNIPDTKSELYRAVTARGLKVPKGLLGAHGSNLAKDKRYDQILQMESFTKAFTGSGGVLDFYAGNHKPLFPGKSMTKTDFTYQLSDHLSLWVQLNTDNDDEQLDQILNPKKR